MMDPMSRAIDAMKAIPARERAKLLTALLNGAIEELYEEDVIVWFNEDRGRQVVIPLGDGEEGITITLLDKPTTCGITIVNDAKTVQRI